MESASEKVVILHLITFQPWRQEKKTEKKRLIINYLQGLSLQNDMRQLQLCKNKLTKNANVLLEHVKEKKEMIFISAELKRKKDLAITHLPNFSSKVDPQYL